MIYIAGKRYYTCNYNYFDNIDTPEKAYWFGFLYADGCIMHHTRVRHLKTMDSIQERFLTQLSLSNRDYHHLEKFLSCIESTHPINIYKNYNGFKEDSKYGRVLIEDRHLFESLTLHGMLENKSLILTYPESIPLELESDFIRGFFDGNGSISKGINNWEISITSTREMLYGIFKRLPCNAEKVFNPRQRYPERNNNCWHLKYGGRQQVFNVLDYMYKNSTELSRLDRKYNKYLMLCEELNGRS